MRGETFLRYVFSKDVIQSIMVLGVGIIAITVISYTSGNVLLAIPYFGAVQGGDAATSVNFMKQAWNLTMANVTGNSQSALSLTSISPLVLGAATIIGILLAVFVYQRMQ